MKTGFAGKERNVFEHWNLTSEQMIACACLGMAQLGFIAVLFNVYCGLTGF